MSDDSKSDNAFDDAKTAMEVVGQVIKIAGKDPQVKEAGANLAKAAVTVTRAINNALLPIAVVNFGFAKARIYFTEQFEKDMEEKTRHIPPERIVEPKASIAGPALQGLAFALDEPDLKSMYLSLLATAMDKEVNQKAHPAFVEIIKQIDPREAEILSALLSADRQQPIVEIRKAVEGNTYQVLQRHYVNRVERETNKEVEDAGFSAAVENWIRLGLIEVSYSTYFRDQEKYSWVEKRELFQSLKKLHESEGHAVTFQRGMIIVTDFAIRFAEAVEIRGNNISASASPTPGNAEPQTDAVGKARLAGRLE
ncbi:DUF4393 domain-containing protein [Paraburkholderia fungorum]|uniref:DUF4393 domain-containing protein n=1 Tax=Paraburkholderia fungorum TaxID=134537 RepID=UPI0038BC8985